MSTAYRIRLLGSPQIQQGENPVRLGTRQGLPLLAYLSETSLELPREALQALLWTEAEASSSFRVLLSRLTGSVPDLLSVTQQSVKLHFEAATWDTSEFWRLCSSPATADLQEALGLYGGEFLQGIELQASERFGVWLASSRTYYSAALGNLVQNLVKAQGRSGKLEQALPTIERWLALEPWQSEAYRLLMQTHWGLGQHDLALEAYERAVIRLAAERGMKPERSLRELAQTIGADRARAQTQARGTALPRRSIPCTLPGSSSAFFGRREERELLYHYLAEAGYRLVTLVGSGGVGKTRLALQVAQDLYDKRLFEDGVLFVSLANVAPSEVVATISRNVSGALGSRPSQNPSLTELQALIGSRHLLLLLDNAEGVTEALESLRELLAGCPNLSLLLSSRVRLNLPEEWLLQLSGLRTQGDSGDSDALRLFLERARQVRPQFAPHPEEHETLQRLCRRLEGHPLALELAAGWLEVLSPAELVQEMERDPDFLLSDAPELAERYGSLRSVFQQSWQLLQPDEQRSLYSLTVLEGAFNREAAQRITGSTPGTLRALVRKSMLSFNGERFERHPLLYSYCREKLLEKPDEEQHLREQHLAYFLGFVQDSMVEDARRADYWEALERDHADLRAALAWAHAQGDSETMITLCHLLFSFWEAYGYWREGQAWLERALSLPGAADERRVRALHAAGGLCFHLSDYETALRYSQEAHRLAQALEQPALSADTLTLCGLVLSFQGKLREAQTTFEEALCQWRMLDGAPKMDTTLNGLANVMRQQGDFVAAERYLQESLRLNERLGDTLGVGLTCGNLGLAAHDRGDLEAAQAYYERCLGIMQTFKLVDHSAHTLRNLGRIAHERGNAPQADALLGESLALYRDLDKAADIALNLSYLARFALERGEYPEALATAQASLEGFRALGLRHNTLFPQLTLAAAYSGLEQPEAEEHYRQALELCRESGGVLEGILLLERLALHLSRRHPAGAAHLYAGAAALRDAKCIPVSPHERPWHARMQETLGAAALSGERGRADLEGLLETAAALLEATSS